MFSCARPVHGLRFVPRPILVAVFICAITTTVVVADGLWRSQQRPPQVPTFRSGTTVIEIHAIVKDPDRRFVDDLAAADFRVTEDGVPQKIDTVYLVTGSRQTDVTKSSSSASAPETRLWAPAPRVFVFLFDLEHMDSAAVVRARAAAAKFLGTEFRGGDLGGIVAGPRLLNNRLTSEREELQAAVGSVQPSFEARSARVDMVRQWPRFLSLYEASRVDRSDDYVIGQVTVRACKDDPGACRAPQLVRAMVIEKSRRLVTEARVAAVHTLTTLDSLVMSLGRLAGRKTVIYLSDGFFAEESWSELRETVGRAARASVVVYALDTRGLNRGIGSSDIIDEPPQDRSTERADPDPFDIGMDGPSSLALDSGGLLIRNENNFGRAFQEIADDTSSYYVLGYRTIDTNERQFRKISVSVTRPGLKVRAWRGYVAGAPAASPAPAPEPPPEAVTPPSPVAAQPARVAANVEPPSPVIDATPVLPPPVGRASSDSTATGLSAPAYRLRPPTSIPSDVARLRDAPATSRGSGSSPALEVQIQEGWDAYQHGDTKAAKIALSSVAGNGAAPAWAHYVLGLAAFAEDDLGLARAEWEYVRSQAPQFTTVYFDLADSLLRQSKTAEALDILREAEKRWPDNIEVLSAVGVLQTSLGRLDEAIVTFRRAVVLAPGDPIAHFNLGSASETRLALAAERSRGSTGPDPGDRERARSEYRRVVELGGSQVDTAREGLARLEPLDATRTNVTTPRVVARLDQDALGGAPARLAWSPDGKVSCFGAVQVPRSRQVIPALRLLSISDGKLRKIDAVPEWANRYWNWKSALRSPWWPELEIAVQEKRPDTLTRSDTWTGRAASGAVYAFKGDIVGEQIGSAASAGYSFGWSPFATGAMAFVDRRGVLMIIDSNGRKREVPDSRGALLPAWSPDGKHVAFLKQDRGLTLMIADIVR